MTELYLHIGTGKAGSSTIQHFLNDHAAALPVDTLKTLGGLPGARLFGVPRRAGAALLTEEIPPKYRPEARAGLDPAAARAEIAATAAPGRRIVVSEECFWHHFGTDGDAIGQLAEALSGLFDRTRIILYLRDQRSFVKSVWSQLVKAGRITLSLEEFVSDPDRLRDLCDYAARIDLWAEAFGADSIRAVPFRRDGFVDGDLVSDFLHRIDLPAGSVDRAGMAVRESNVSPTYLQLELVRRATRLGLSPQLARRWLRTRHTRRLSRAPIPDRFDARILAAASPGNARLNATFLKDFPEGLPVAP